MFEVIFTCCFLLQVVNVDSLTTCGNRRHTVNQNTGPCACDSHVTQSIAVEKQKLVSVVDVA